jgi:hypothetical protein
MLNKAICLHCYLKRDICSTAREFFEQNWNHPFYLVHCGVGMVNGGNNRTFYPPAKDCPYVLEHLLMEQSHAE